MNNLVFKETIPDALKKKKEDISRYENFYISKNKFFKLKNIEIKCF